MYHNPVVQLREDSLFGAMKIGVFVGGRSDCETDTMTDPSICSNDTNPVMLNVDEHRQRVSFDVLGSTHSDGMNSHAGGVTFRNADSFSGTGRAGEGISGQIVGS